MSNLIRYKCPFCDKGIGVRPDQLGRRIRCPSCKQAFSIELAAVSSTENIGQVPREPEQQPEPDPEPAPDANEMIRAKPDPKSEWPRAKMSATFPNGRDVVFAACVQAARSGSANIVSVDRSNHHLRFTLDETDGSRSDHELFVFDAVGGASDVEVSSDAKNQQYRFDEFYRRMFAELGKFLLFAPPSAPQQFASAPQPTPSPPPPPPPPPPHVFVYNNNNSSPDDRDDSYLRQLQDRRRSREGSDGLGIAGFVCGIVGVVFFCLPLLGGGLGVLATVFGGISLASGKKKNGFGVAALTLGLVACLLSIIYVIYLTTLHTRRPYYYD